MGLDCYKTALQWRPVLTSCNVGVGFQSGSFAFRVLFGADVIVLFDRLNNWCENMKIKQFQGQYEIDFYLLLAWCEVEEGGGDICINGLSLIRFWMAAIFKLRLRTVWNYWEQLRTVELKGVTCNLIEYFQKKLKFSNRQSLSLVKIGCRHQKLLVK